MLNWRAALFTLQLAVICAYPHAGAQAQPSKLALKSGETIDLGAVYYITNCRSIMIGLPEVEILEGPPELSLAIKAEQVLPRRFNCAAKVPGGTLRLIAKDIKERTEANLVYRLKFKTKDGDRQTSNSYTVILFP